MKNHIIGWFQVRVNAGSDLNKRYRLASHIYYWAMRREDGKYVIFGNSQHGPHVRASEEEMKACCTSIRNNEGKLRVATDDEAKEIGDNLIWFLSK